MDNTCKEKRGSINLSKFVSLCPNAKVGSKDHGFAVETEERKYILRAPDAVTKNIWIAKLCQLCGQGKKRNGGSRDGGGGGGGGGGLCYHVCGCVFVSAGYRIGANVCKLVFKLTSVNMITIVNTTGFQTRLSEFPYAAFWHHIRNFQINSLSPNFFLPQSKCIT